MNAFIKRPVAFRVPRVAQLFVVDNPKNGAVYIFDNHDAALKCRTELRLNWEHLRGCVIFSDWQDGQPVRLP